MSFREIGNHRVSHLRKSVMSVVVTARRASSFSIARAR
jgi:hypothetical protein